jgi:urease accessory protein
VTAIDAPFDPEGGAYHGGHGHDHHHHHNPALDHDDRIEDEGADRG